MVTKIKVGDHVGVGCMVDSCGNCKSCKSGHEQKCRKQVRGVSDGMSDGKLSGPIPSSTVLCP
jgi:D-arabinose 1-dehydrogenase-like Zn-dependent alcohol dehydrogenase